MTEKISVRDEAFRRLSYRLYSAKELSRHLKSLDYSDIEIENTITELTEKEYLNDRKFVESYVTGRGMRRLMSVRSLVYELKSVTGYTDWLEDVIRTTYNEFNGGEEAVLEKLIDKKNAAHSELNKAEEKKLVDYLRRKGFEYENIQNAVCRLKSK